jgi:hypothetical protein
MSKSNVIKMPTNNRILNAADNVKRLTQAAKFDVWLVCVGLAEAKDACEEEGELWSEFTESVDWKLDTADGYVRIAKELPVRGRVLSEKGCSFSTLQALAARDLPKAVQKRLIDKMVKKEYIDRKYGAAIQAEVRAALPSTKLVAVKAVIVRRDAFAERLEYADKFDVSAEWLFDLPTDYCPETASLVVKYWKQKYHPDRGGSKYMFALLTEKAERLEVK